MKGFTKHQSEILIRLNEGERLGTHLDFDQLLESLSYQPSKEAAQFTVRNLVKKGLIEKLPLQKRRGRMRVCYKLTQTGTLVVDPRGKAVESGTPGKVVEISPDVSFVPEIPADEVLE